MMESLLPPLREDLQLKQSERDSLGQVAWVIHDPARNAFFSLDWLSSELIKRWFLRDANQVLESVNRETTLDADAQDLQELTEFLARNELLQVYSTAATDRLAQRSESHKPGFFGGLFKHYLYLRVPLFNPEPILRALTSWVKPLGTSWFQHLTSIVLIVGLFQLGRRWDSFTHSFGEVFNLQTLLQVALVVALVKILHEFGHAFAAYDRGCRVPRMGIVFLVLFPVAYTDVTDSWKLSPRDRMAIGIAGIRVELMVAAWATLIWGLLPSGGIRDGVFLVLTVTWIGTLLVNASPFMRFDGYFVLMDYWRVPNLHQRAGALGRWWLRKLFLGVDHSAPEYLGGQRNRLIAFALTTWSYRLIVFIAIAWMVYQLFPQPFGLILASIELGFFILLPLWRELRLWPSLMLQSLFKPQLWILWLCILGLTTALLYPYRDSVSVQGVALPEREIALTVQETSLIQSTKLKEGKVMQGDLVASLDNPELRYELQKLKLRQSKLEWTLSQSGFVADLLATGSQLRAELLGVIQQVDALEQRLAALQIRAPIDGYFVPPDQHFAENSWVSIGTELGTIHSHNRVVMGYVNSLERHWIGLDRPIIWESEVFDETRILQGLEVANQAVESIELSMLLKVAGGDLNARRTSIGWIPDEAVYKFKAPYLGSSTNPYAHERGRLEIPTRPHSNWMLFSAAIRRQIHQDFGVNLSLLSE